MILEVYTDGGARGNPGPAAVGGIGTANGQKIFEFSEQIGNATNNIAEYTALLKAFSEVKKYIFEEKKDIDKVIFYSDSNLMVSQLNGLYKIKNPNLREIIAKIKILEIEIGNNIVYKHISREKNKIADRLVNKSFEL